MIIRRVRRTAGTWHWEVRSGDKVAFVTRQQGLILGVMAINPGSLTERATLEDMLWGHREDGGPNDTNRVVDLAIAEIRDRLARALIPWTIEANWGRGFRLCHVDTIRYQTRWVKEHRARLSERHENTATSQNAVL